MGIVMIIHPNYILKKKYENTKVSFLSRSNIMLSYELSFLLKT